ncbi:hypothetical protein NPIL_347131, partial [Nephila pilipes]
FFHNAQSPRNKRSGSLSQQELQQGKRIIIHAVQVIKMACIDLVTFMCWSPMQVATLYSKVWFSGTQQGELPSWFPHFQYTSMLLVHFNCALNPFLYAVLSKDFRRSLFRVVRCKVTRQSGRP